jgi:sortase (surface protein transpeptidase)
MSTSLAILAIVGGGVLAWQTVQTNATATTQVAHLKAEAAAVEAQSSASPAPTADSAPKEYSVAPDLPRYISIPKLGIKNAKVIRVGLTKDGAVGTPVDGWSTAWYTGSAKPGTPGQASFIDGHVLADAKTPGVFGKLKDLAAGDTITITKGDGGVLTYKVVRTALVALDAVEMADMMRPAEAGKSGLNLMTCGGTFNSKADSFDHRTEVFASLEP